MEESQDIRCLCVLKHRVEMYNNARFEETGGFGNEIFHEWQRMGKRIAKNSLVFVFLFVAICGFLFVGIRGVAAAEIQFVPGSGSYKVGDTFPVSIVVSSADKAMNAASGRVLFPPSKLQVSHISKGNSVLNLWIQEPVYSNTAGTVDFEGISFNPGYQGVRGEILTVTFMVKSGGSIPLSFAYGSVLANDGQGTDILTSLGSALFDVPESGGGAVALPPKTVQKPVVPRSLPPVQTLTVTSAPAGTPRAPKIQSSSHPAAKDWYSGQTATFSWKVPDGVLATRLLFGAIKNVSPTVLYENPIAEKAVDLTEMPDGTYYFHAQFKNKAGWGETGHFQFNVDNTSPEDIVASLEDTYVAGPQFSYFVLKARDALSGIDRYEITIDGKIREEEKGGNVTVYVAPVLPNGIHSVVVTAFDKAGNSLAADEHEFEVNNAAVLLLGPLSYMDQGAVFLMVFALLLIAFICGWIFHTMGGWIVFLPLFLISRGAYHVYLWTKGSRRMSWTSAALRAKQKKRIR